MGGREEGEGRGETNKKLVHNIREGEKISPTISVTWFVCPLNVLTILLVSVSTISTAKLSHDTANMELPW